VEIRSCSAARLLAGVLLLGATLTRAAGTPLDAYLDNLKTLRASFLQTLADPKGRARSTAPPARSSCRGREVQLGDSSAVSQRRQHGRRAADGL
jgi:hypothetical protein